MNRPYSKTKAAQVTEGTLKTLGKGVVPNHAVAPENDAG